MQARGKVFLPRFRHPPVRRSGSLSRHCSGVAMLKRLAICCALVLAAGSSSAPEREAILQKIEVPGTNFEMLVATTKPGGAIYDLGESPDALIIHLIGTKLWVGFDEVAEMLETMDILRRPLGSSHVANNEPDPTALYLTPTVKTYIDQIPLIKRVISTL